MKFIKHKCCMCGKTATWYKLIHVNGESLYYCDDCVPRTSLQNVCNLEEDGEPFPETSVMWWGENCVARDFAVDGTKTRTSDSFYYEYLDENGNRKPSLKFVPSKLGFVIRKDEATITHDDIFKAYSACKEMLPSYQSKTIGTLIADILIEYNGFDSNSKVSYNYFMSKLGDEVKDRLPLILHNNNLHKFYIAFKKILSELKYSPNNTVLEASTKNNYAYESTH